MPTKTVPADHLVQLLRLAEHGEEVPGWLVYAVEPTTERGFIAGWPIELTEAGRTKLTALSNSYPA